MTLRVFKKIIKRQIEECYRPLLNRRGIYDRNEDTMSQFKDGAILLDQTPEQVLLGMWAKHLITLLTCIKQGKEVSTYVEHITDSINYLILLRCLYEEKKGGNDA